MKKLHAQVRARIEKVNDLYKQRANKKRTSITYKEGDLVWLDLGKERFPQKRTNKVMPRCDGPFKITKKVGDNAYQLDLSDEYGVSATFNIGDFAPYIPNDQLQNLRSNSFEEREEDAQEDSDDHDFESLMVDEKATMGLLIDYGDMRLMRVQGTKGSCCMITYTGAP